MPQTTANEHRLMFRDVDAAAQVGRPVGLHDELVGRFSQNGSSWPVGFRVHFHTIVMDQLLQPGWHWHSPSCAELDKLGQEEVCIVAWLKVATNAEC